MEEDNGDASETVRRAVNRFERRKNRNKPNTNLLELLKHSREAAGQPLNPVKEAIAVQREEPKPEEPEGEEEAQQVTPELKQDTPSQFIDINPWQQTPFPEHIKDSDQGRTVTFRSPNQTDLSDSFPQKNLLSISGESWQNDKSVTECNLYMLTYEIGSDVTLLVGETQEIINAHSYVLSSRSKQFADILYDQRKLASKQIIIRNVNPETFRHLLRYLYTDEIELNVDLAAALIPVSFAYGPSSLKSNCFSYLLSEMSSDNACIILEHAHKFREKDVYDRCKNFINVNAVDVLTSPNFKTLCCECVEDLIKCDDLNADEFTVFEALLIWANGECSRKRIQPTDQSRREALGNLLFLVRFAVMDAIEFTQKISHREILSQEEKIVLYQFFHGETYKLPSKFTKSRRHEYQINRSLVTKAFRKDRPRIDLPAISSPNRFHSIPYKYVEEREACQQIQRVIRFQGVGKDWQTKGPDAIEFRVSDPIILRGVQLFGTCAGRESYQVDFKVFDDFKDEIRHDVKTIDTGGTTKVYDVKLTSPVRVPEGKTFTIQTNMRGKSTFHGVNGLELVDASGVTFQFLNSNRSLNGSDVTIGQIPAILFSKL